MVMARMPLFSNFSIFFFFMTSNEVYACLIVYKTAQAGCRQNVREWEKKARNKKWRGKILGESAALSVDLLAGGLPLGGLISGAVDHVAGGSKGRRIQNDTDIAYSILKSIM